MSQSRREGLRNVSRVNYNEAEEESTESEGHFLSEFSSGSVSSSSEISSVGELDTTVVTSEVLPVSEPSTCVGEVESAPPAISLATTMGERVTGVSADVEMLKFQIEEIVEIVREESLALSLDSLTQHHNELKDLRIRLVRAQKELELLQGNSPAAQVDPLTQSSKEAMKTLRTRMSELEKDKDQAELSKVKQEEGLEELKSRSRKLAFDTLQNEIHRTFVTLNAAFTAPSRDLSRDQMLRRKDEQPGLALEYDRFRERVDKLVCDVETQFQGKEQAIQTIIDLNGTLEAGKLAYEKKVYDDLLTNDLTDDKLKLAEQTTIEIGKFSGTDGEDYYTFKSKFYKAYAHHPKSLMVEWLKNNHLGGLAKECVGSLEDIDAIWQRLLDNFGNAERMLCFRFKKINVMGPMSRKRTYTDKKFYLQTLINAMQDVLDLATEHDLTGELHYGAQLLKVVGLLDTYLQNGWYKVIAQENVAKPQRWTRLIIYLEAELTIVQTKALELESVDVDPASSRGKALTPNAAPPARQSAKNVVNVVQKELCAMCDDAHINANQNLLHCRKFLVMKHKERAEHLRRKQFCLQCMSVLTRWNDPAHQCTDAWICPNAVHDKYQRKNHLLVCGQHAKEDDNKKLLELFISQFLTAPWQQKIASSPSFHVMPMYNLRYPAPHQKQSLTTLNSVEDEVVEPQDEPVAHRKQSLTTLSSVEEESVEPQDEPVPHRKQLLTALSPVEEEPEEESEEESGEESVEQHGEPVPTLFHTEAVEEEEDTCLITEGATDLPDATSAPPPVFILQPARMPKLHPTRVFNILFDSGCMDMCSRKDAIDHIPEQYKENTVPGPLLISGVGGVQATSPHGHYRVELPIHDGRMAKFSGICLDQITSPMPPYPVREASKEIVEAYRAKGGDVRRLPDVPTIVGGPTDFLIGIRYNYFLPKLVFMLPTGLAIYKSIFRGVDGTRGCIGGSSAIFEMCERIFMQTANLAITFKDYIHQQLQLYRNGVKICVDVDTIPMTKFSGDRHVTIVNENCKEPPAVLLASKKRLHNEAEEAGSLIEYRCIRCRGCSDCKRGEHIESVSLREEDEQSVIDSSVFVDFEARRTTALLPFMVDPVENLESNEKNADRVYAQQVKKLSRAPPAVKEAVLLSEMKLQESGHVEWLKNLTPEEIGILNSSLAKYYMPWRYVHNEGSVTTPVRIVFDASSVSRSGMSLNDTLAKGMNSLNSLLEIFLRFRCYTVAIHTDVTKMYNVLKLLPQHWTFQRYKWQMNLDPLVPPDEKVIKTVIYGVRPSGNQATVGLRITAREQKKEFPAAALAVEEDTYADDCGTGTMQPNADKKADKLVTDIQKLLAKGGFITKGFTRSGGPPPLGLSKDGVSINVLGAKWHSEPDKLQLGVGPVNFGKKHRGRRLVDVWEVPEKLTKRICAGKVAEVFDIVGFLAPVVAGLKLCMRELVVSCLGWDDRIPDSYRKIWLSNFKKISRAGELLFDRAVVPDNAVSLDIELICAGDASEKMICAATYIRFKLEDGGNSCQLVLAKTKVVPEDTSVPRAELMGSTLNVHIREVVCRALRNDVTDMIFVLDSEIVLYWLSSNTKRLKPFVRNRVIEILRFANPEDWYHVPSELNPADLGTRGNVEVEECSQESEWINGLPWMSLPMDEIRNSHVKSLEDIQIRNEHAAEIRKEQMKPAVDLCNAAFHLVSSVSGSEECYVACGGVGDGCYLTDNPVFGCYPTDEVAPVGDSTTQVMERLDFSQYIVNPNKFNFYKVVRIVAIVIKVAKVFLAMIGRTSLYTYPQRKVNHTMPLEALEYTPRGVAIALTDVEIAYSFDYFFRKGTLEVKKYVPQKLYKNITREENGILYYCARVSPEDVRFECEMTKTMRDLTVGTFVVPVVDRHSPLAYAIVNEIHWYHPTASHRGVETTIRHIMTVAHIFNVRELAKMFRKRCARCRFLLKLTLDVEMAPASQHQVCVAPPFYVTQTDLCGPFDAYSKHNRRTTVKIWIVAFVCATTSMTSLKVMEAYDTTQFLQAFSRFACELGYPKRLLVDAGSQLVSGCGSMMLDFVSMKGVLNREYGILFDVCPVGGHNYHGRVERKIRSVKETISKSFHNHRLSILQWETLCAEVGNCMNNLPIAIGNETDDLESIDLITPNRLRLGRNNDRSPIGTLDVSSSVDRILDQNSKIFDCWWEAWLTSALPKLVPQPKWFKSDENLQIGDIVLFRKVEGSFAGQYKFGAVKEVHLGSDGRIRAVVLRYKNSTEEVERTVQRAVRSVVVIHRIDELDIMEELGKATLLAGDV